MLVSELFEDERLDEGKVGEIIHSAIDFLNTKLKKYGIKASIIAGTALAHMVAAGPAEANNGFDKCNYVNNDTIVCQMRDGSGVQLTGVQGHNREEIQDAIDNAWKQYIAQHNAIRSNTFDPNYNNGYYNQGNPQYDNYLRNRNYNNDQQEVFYRSRNAYSGSFGSNYDSYQYRKNNGWLKGLYLLQTLGNSLSR